MINIGVDTESFNPFIGKIITIDRGKTLNMGVEIDKKTLKPKESFIRFDWEF